MPDARSEFAKRLIADDPNISDDDLAASLKVFDARNTTRPTKPVSAEDFAPAPGNVWTDAGIGLLKGAGQTVANIAEMAAETLPGVGRGGMIDPAMRNPLFRRTDEALAPTNEAQDIGKMAETAAEFAGPAARLATAVPGIVKALPGLARKVGPTALNVAEHVPVIGRPIRILRMIGNMVESAAPKATSQNAGGKLVRTAAPSAEDEIAAVLSEMRTPTPPAKITTPPPRDLPAGFTPRTSIPKPKPAKASLPAEKAAAAEPSPPKRAYFLRPAKEAAASEPVAPLGRAVTIEDLPASWRPRVDTPLTKPGGPQLSQADVLGEMQRRGLSAEESFEGIAKDPKLTNTERLHLRNALLAMLQ